MRRFDILNISVSPEVIYKFNAVPTRTPNILFRIFSLQNYQGKVNMKIFRKFWKKE